MQRKSLVKSGRGVYKPDVPNQRSSNQKVIALWLDRAFVRALDAARHLTGMDRSTFIRFAIAEELKAKNIAYDPKHVFAPDRTGKGGRRRQTQAQSTTGSSALNETAPPFGNKRVPPLPTDVHRPPDLEIPPSRSKNSNQKG
jgi:hypothetical protein